MNGIYFSGSGHTKHCAEFFAQLTGGRAASIEDAAALDLIKESDELFVAYPIHYSDLPKIVRDFLTQNAAAFCGKKRCDHLFVLPFQKSVSGIVNVSL